MARPQKNVPYSRTEIRNMIGGGELQSYLPQQAKRILAGCFALKHMNPHAPAVVQVGNAQKVTAKAVLLSKQRDNRFPVFVKDKRSDREYYFQGYFRFKSISNSPSDIADAERASGRHGELSCVLHLEPV